MGHPLELAQELADSIPLVLTREERQRISAFRLPGDPPRFRPGDMIAVPRGIDPRSRIRWENDYRVRLAGLEQAAGLR